MAHITDRMYTKRWGVFNHYIHRMVMHNTDISWCDAINAFDVKKLTSCLHEAGAGYYVITVCQGSRYIIAPNETYFGITGAQPGQICSQRDIISELYDELAKYDIDLYLYFPSDGPHNDPEFGAKIGLYYTDDDVYDTSDGTYRIKNGKANKLLSENRLTDEYIRNWSSVLEEYAVRYGNKISGWWFDGFYDFFGFDEKKIKPFYDAVKKGNSNTLTAFNNGVKKQIARWYPKEEFTAGEFNEFGYIPDSRFTDGAQSHILAPLGTGWGTSDSRYSGEYMHKYINSVNEKGGVVTVDIGVGYDGSFSEEQMKVLKAIR